jgi:hypothetical protein
VEIVIHPRDLNLLFIAYAGQSHRMTLSFCSLISIHWTGGVILSDLVRIASVGETLSMMSARPNATPSVHMNLYYHLELPGAVVMKAQ